MELTTRRPIHPFCELVPLPTAEQFQALATDILERGVIDQPVMIYHGQILDGRCRSAIGEMHNIEVPEFEFIGSELDALRFVKSHNLARRHLTTSQLAMLGAKLAEEIGSREVQNEDVSIFSPQPKGPNPSGKNRAGQSATERRRKDRHRKAQSVNSLVAAVLGTNAKYVEQAAIISRDSPDLRQAVIEGQLNIPGAMAELAKRRSDLVDSAGHPVPANLEEAFRDDAAELAAIGREIDKLIRRVEALSESPGGRFMVLARPRADLKNAKGYLLSIAPHAVCPECAGVGCEQCKQSGFITKPMHERRQSENGVKP